MILESMTSPEAEKAHPGTKVVLVPLGSFEQHGPHLPLSTDTDIVTAIARGVERARPRKILLLPALWVGHSTHHLAYAGTLSTHQMPYITLLLELCASAVATLGARRIFLLNGHGGNDAPARTALRELKDECPDVRIAFASYWSLASRTIAQVRESPIGGIGHACELETSLMLHLHPDRVRMALAKPDGPPHTDPFRTVDMQHPRPAYFVSEFDELSATGTIGHPQLATADKGARFFAGIVDEVTTFVDAFAKW